MFCFGFQVNELFSPLPSHGTVEIPDFTAKSLLLPFDELLFARAFKVVPLFAVNQLNVSWVLPPMKQKVHAELKEMQGFKNGKRGN